MKLQEMREKTIEELKEAVLEQKKALFNLRMKNNKLNSIENPAQIRETKRTIARIKTIIRQKEMVQNA